MFDLITNTDFLLKSNVIPEQHKDTLKALVTNDYINYFKRNPQMSPEQKLINQLYHQTIKFLKDHPEIYIINSDKGQKTVIIDKIDYENKMKQHLSDANTYTALPNNKLNINSILEKRVTNIINELHING